MMYDFSFANLWDGAFPSETWRGLVDDILARDSAQMSRYTALGQPSSLATSLCRILHDERGIRCTPEQIVFGAGTDGVLTTILQLFSDRPPLVGTEEPGYIAIPQIANRTRHTLVPLPVSDDPREFADALGKGAPTVIYTTPSRQFPTGRAMPEGLRAQVLEWAQRADAYVIEDDTCWEYRFDGKSVPALQAQDDHDRVIYVGNMSKALSPGMRIAYAVLPPQVMEKYRALFSFAHEPVSHLEAEVLARFIDEGHWEPHLQRMREGMKLRHDTMAESLSRELGDIASLSGVGSGMHLFASVENGMTQEELVTRARDAGAAVYGADLCWFSQPAPTGTVILGFSSFDVADIPAAASALARAWR